jgi:nucleoside-diphosphate-sugar epimerase
MGKQLIVGAAGQLGIELMLALQKRVGPEQVVLADIRPVPHPSADQSPFVHLDATDGAALNAVLVEHDVEVMFMLVAMLSAKGETMPLAAWDLNMSPLLLALEAAKEGKVKQVFWPSSIAVFGPDAPKDATPQDAGLTPTTVYGVSKVAGELWCKYYHDKFGVDVRSLRYPGLIGFRSQPGGGTTDYAVEAFHRAAAGEALSCYLDANERLPMMSMEDAVRGTLELMAAPSEDIRVRTSYNLNGCDFTPAELVAAIRTHVPEFAVSYTPDRRQDIAASWPNSLDDSAARRDWGWKPQHDVSGLVEHMFQGLQQPA